jgi:CrcB protein
MDLANIMAVAVSGAVGSVARYLAGIGSGKLLGMDFPWSTLIINIFGSFVLGTLVETFALKWSADQTTRVLLTVGLCGGFTTFSTFSLDAVSLITRGATLYAAIYTIASVAFSIGCLYAGLHLMRVIFD